MVMMMMKVIVMVMVMAVIVVVMVATKAVLKASYIDDIVYYNFKYFYTHKKITFPHQPYVSLKDRQ